MCVCVCVCVCKKIFFFLLVQKEKKVNISKGIGLQRDLYSFENYLFRSYTVFPAYCFLQRTFNVFSSVSFSLYRDHCFDGVVVSFNFMIDSLLGLALSFSIFSFFLPFSL